MPEMHPTTQYAHAVVAGKVTVGKWVRLACERHLRDLERTDGLYEFSPEVANHALHFFQFCHHSKGEWAGTTIKLEPWQTFIVGCAFGWIRKSDGLRRFRIVYVEIARKNSKSTTASGVGLFLFYADGEPGAEVYTAATKRDQARIVHAESVRMVKASPELKKRITVLRDNLIVEGTASKFEPLGADEDTLDGLNVHAAVVDEYHAHKTTGVFNVLDTATGSRRQPMLFVITTAGTDKRSPCGEFHDYCEKVLSGTEGISDDTVFAYIASIDEEDDPFDESCWEKANPNLNVSVKLDDLRRKAAKAKELPSARSAFEQLHCNRWVEGFDKWLLPETWAKCGADLNIDNYRGRSCYAGLDLSSTQDLTGLVLAFQNDDGGYDVFPFAWIPEESAARKERMDRVPYRYWAKQGFVTLTEGEVVDYAVLHATIRDLSQKFHLAAIGCDRWNASMLITQLQADGLNVVAVGQGFRDLSDPTKQTERLILSGELRHPRHPVLDFCISNTVLERDAAGNVKPSKKKSVQRIDLSVALIMAIGIGNVTPTNQPELILL